MGHSQIWNSFLKVKSALRRIGLLSVMFQICFKNDAFVAWKFLIWYLTLKTMFSTPAVQGKNIYFWNAKRLHLFCCLSMLTHFKNFNIKIMERIQSNEAMILGVGLQRGGAPFAFQLQSCRQSFCLGRSLKTSFTLTICLLN